MVWKTVKMEENFGPSISITPTSHLFSDILTLLVISLCLAQNLTQYRASEIFGELELCLGEKRQKHWLVIQASLQTSGPPKASAGLGFCLLEQELPSSRASTPHCLFPSPMSGPLCVRGHETQPVYLFLPCHLTHWVDFGTSRPQSSFHGKRSPTNACCSAHVLAPDALQAPARKDIVLQGIETPPTETGSLLSLSAHHRGNPLWTSGVASHTMQPQEGWDHCQEGLSLIFVAIMIKPRCFSISELLEGSLISWL